MEIFKFVDNMSFRSIALRSFESKGCITAMCEFDEGRIVIGQAGPAHVSHVSPYLIRLILCTSEMK